MKWLIKDSLKSHVVEIPDALGSDRLFKAKVGDQSFDCSWHMASQTLIIMTPTGPRHFCARSIQKERFAGETETKLHIEYWNPQRKSVEILRLSGQTFAPGSENRAGQNKSGKNQLRAPMTGKVLSVFVKDGEVVEQGQVILVVEAMKMENKIYAPSAGKIEKLKVTAGQSVSVGQEILKIEAK